MGPMAQTPELMLIEPIRASTLLELDGGNVPPATSAAQLSQLARRAGMFVQGLEKTFATLWTGGKVAGIGTVNSNEESMGRQRPSLSLHVVAATLLGGQAIAQPAMWPSSATTSTSAAATLPTVHIILPHTYQTIPSLHALLANTLSNSPAAIELLKNVRLLQYFDLAGLAESVAEVQEAIYKQTKTKDSNSGTRQIRCSGQLEDIVLVQGIGQTVAATHRRSGLLQANALLADLTRNITQLSRISNGVLVLVDFVVDVEIVSDRATSKSKKFAIGMELESAFSNPSGGSLRLVCGNESLSRTLEAGFDCTVVVHDGFGRVGDGTTRETKKQETVVEVVKDRVGTKMGLWALWRPEAKD